jgi:RimJ/RimL family protein N-acetyltransferase
MMAHLGRPFSEDQAASRIDTWNQQWSELGWGGGVVVDKATSVSIGTAKLILTKLPDYIGSHEVGYMVLPQHQGKCFASEIAAGAVRYLFERVRAQRVVADVHPDNGPSNRVLEKLGFLDQGVKNYTQPDFAGYDRQRIWLLPQEKWEADNTNK